MKTLVCRCVSNLVLFGGVSERGEEDIAVGSGFLSSLLAETKERNRRCMQESGVSKAATQHNLSLEGETSGSDMINSKQLKEHKPI